MNRRRPCPFPQHWSPPGQHTSQEWAVDPTHYLLAVGASSAIKFKMTSITASMMDRRKLGADALYRREVGTR
jgi:hypothetical protein